MKTDTIAAIATAVSNSGIGIIRISGEEALNVADRIFRPKKGDRKVSDMESHTVHYGYITDGEEVIDEVLLIVMRAPKTYTCEDVVEIRLPWRGFSDKKTAGNCFKIRSASGGTRRIYKTGFPERPDRPLTGRVCDRCDQCQK